MGKEDLTRTVPAEYDSTMTNAAEQVLRTIVNKHPGDCRRCGLPVAVGTGQAVKLAEGWRAQHTDGACPTAGREQVVQPKSAQIDFTPTAEQAACVPAFATLEDLVIQAGAGAGKSSTLRLLAQHAQANGRTVQVTAFNRKIIEDLAGKMPGNTNVSTLHSLARQAVGHRFSHRLNGARQRPEVQASVLGIKGVTVTVGTSGTRELAAGFLAARVMGAVKRFCQSGDLDLSGHHFEYIEGIDLPDEHGDRTFANNNAVAASLLPFARKAWADLCDPKGSLRFDHDHYLKMWALDDPRISADVIMLDEAQDSNGVTIQIIENLRRYGVQVVCVGDEQQQIYSWRGAIDAMARFEQIGANVAFLSQSFRFGDAVAEVANGLLGRLNARLRLRGFGPMASTVGPVDEPRAILCRTNAGAISEMLDQIAADRRPHLVGKADDILGFCRGALALQDGRRSSFAELACFQTWGEVQTFAEDESGSDLKLMVRLIDRFGAQTIIDAIENQPTEDKADVVISTAHKAKGLEWDSVVIASDFAAPKAKGEDLSAEELRTAYVAVTRARRALDLSNVPHLQAGWTPGDGGQGAIPVAPEPSDDFTPTASLTPAAPTMTEVSPAPVSAAETGAGAAEVADPDPSGLHTVTLGTVTYYSRFVGRCAKCGEVVRHEIPASTPIRKQGWARYGMRWSCGCGAKVLLRAVAGTVSEGRCDPRCWNAYGDDCTCSCGGSNHATGHPPVKADDEDGGLLP